jgi:hypothetical protein
MFAINHTYRALFTMALLATTLASFAEKLVPAGTLIQCTVSETKLSSKTVAIGDPVLCQVGRSGTFPSGSVLSGRFEDYKDPGHLVGKGWMELVFDRMIFASNDIVPIDSKVVGVPHYSVDVEGKILGKGHDTRDTLTWLLPVLWPIDLINLPRRGPRPTLKSESRIAIKVMEDIVIPDMAPTIHNQYGFTQRKAPVSYVAPLQIEAQPEPQQVALEEGPGLGTIFVLTDGYRVHANGYGYTQDGQVRYRSIEDNNTYVIPLVAINFDVTLACNRHRGVKMLLPNGQVDYAKDNLGGGYHFAPMNLSEAQRQSQGNGQRQAPRQQYVAQNQTRVLSSGGGSRRR